MASNYANLWEEKKLFMLEKGLTPTGFVWNTNMAAFALLLNTNMVGVMYWYENALQDTKNHQNCSENNNKKIKTNELGIFLCVFLFCKEWVTF